MRVTCIFHNKCPNALLVMCIHNFYHMHFVAMILTDPKLQLRLNSVVRVFEPRDDPRLLGGGPEEEQAVLPPLLHSLPRRGQKPGKYPTEWEQCGLRRG